MCVFGHFYSPATCDADAGHIVYTCHTTGQHWLASNQVNFYTYIVQDNKKLPAARCSLGSRVTAPRIIFVVCPAGRIVVLRECTKCLHELLPGGGAACRCPSCAVSRAGGLLIAWCARRRDSHGVVGTAITAFANGMHHGLGRHEPSPPHGSCCCCCCCCCCCWWWWCCCYCCCCCCCCLRSAERKHARGRHRRVQRSPRHHSAARSIICHRRRRRRRRRPRS